MLFSHSSTGLYVDYSHITDGEIRVLFRVYFIVLMILIAVAGTWACRLHVRHTLLKGHAVPLTATTGWLQGPSFARVFVQMRRLPGGWLGWLMVFATILDLIGEFGVANSVTLTNRASRMAASQGMIIGDPSLFNEYPQPNFQPYTMAISAQINSITNAKQASLTSQIGIYRLVPTEYWDFMASSEDVIGQWACAQTNNQPLIYDQTFQGDADQIWDDDIWTDLVNRGLLYKDAYSSNFSLQQTHGSMHGPSYQLVILSASDITYGNVFDFKVAVDIQDAADDSGTKTMATFMCQLHSKDNVALVQDILKQISVDDVMPKWLPPISGGMYEDPHSKSSYDIGDIVDNLAMYFNSMTMVAGSGQSVSTNNSDGYTYGYLQYVTIIPFWIIIVCLFVALLSLFLMIYAIWLYIAIRARSLVYDRSGNHGHVPSKEIRDNTPVGMLDWMKHVVYVSRDIEQIPKSRHLQQWNLSTRWHAGRRLGIVRHHEHGHINPMRAPGTTPRTTRAFHQGYFPTTKEDYIKVSTSENVGV